MFESRHLSTDTKTALSNLTSDEQVVLKLTYGIDCNQGDELKMPEVATATGFKYDKVKRLKRDAMTKLRGNSSLQEYTENFCASAE